MIWQNNLFSIDTPPPPPPPHGTLESSSKRKKASYPPWQKYFTPSLCLKHTFGTPVKSAPGQTTSGAFRIALSPALWHTRRLRWGKRRRKAGAAEPAECFLFLLPFFSCKLKRTTEERRSNWQTTQTNILCLLKSPTTLTRNLCCFFHIWVLTVQWMEMNGSFRVDLWESWRSLMSLIFFL